MPKVVDWGKMWRGYKKDRKAEKERIRKEIFDNFQDREFTMGDIYYSIFNKFNKTLFGKVYVYIRQFHKAGLLKAMRKLNYSGNKKTTYYKIKNLK